MNLKNLFIKLPSKNIVTAPTIAHEHRLAKEIPKSIHNILSINSFFLRSIVLYVFLISYIYKITHIINAKI